MADPWLAHASFGSDPLAAGILLGTSIHDTSQVVRAALLYSQTLLVIPVDEASIIASEAAALLQGLALQSPPPTPFCW